MSTQNCEKDSLLGHTLLVKRPHSNFERGHFYLYTLYMLEYTGTAQICDVEPMENNEIEPDSTVVL